MILLVLVMTLVLPSMAAPTKSLSVSVSFDPKDALRQTKGFSVSLDNFTDAEIASDIANLTNPDNWVIFYRGSRIQVFNLQESFNTVVMDCSSSALPSYRDLKFGELTAMYTSPGQNPISGSFNPVKKSPQLSFVDTAKDADISLSGDIQTAVSAAPQYEWDIEAKYPVTLFRTYGSISPTISSKASQQTNADPDSSKISVTYEKAISFKNSRQGLILDADLIGYEFERKAKQEAVLIAGIAKLQTYQQKNTNFIWDDTIHYVPGGSLSNATVNLGTEYGSTITRSVRTTGTTTSDNNSILRSVLGIDFYQNFFLHCEPLGKPCTEGEKTPWISFDGHYTLRSPFEPEPFKQTYVNNGNEFLTTKPRHYANLNAKLALHSGIGVLFKYEYGSLPPTFTFLDNQLTIGLQVLLKHN